jgi:protein ImuB
MTKPSERYACLYAKEFPTQALLHLRPELHDRPCVVMKGEAPLQQVCSLNMKARLLGLKHGMTQVEVDTFSGPVVLSRSCQAEREARAILLECAGAFSPRVEDQSEETAFLCAIDIAGTESLFGPPEMLAKSLLQRIRSLGITTRLTISSNFHAAVCLSRGLAPRFPVKEIAHGNEATELAPLPLTVLDLTAAQAETFSLWGIHTLGMLAALPETELIARMGQEGKRIRQLARGECPHLFQPVEPVFTLVERVELNSPVELLNSLLFVIGVMLDQLILRARARIFALASVTVILTLDGSGAHSRTVRPALPTNDKQIWIKLLHLDLEAHPPRAPILALTLTAEPGSTTKIQLGLFSPQLPESGRLDVVLARIRAIVGEDCVGRAVLQDTHAPDGFRMEAFTVPSCLSTAVVTSKPRSSMRQIRPREAVSVTLQEYRPGSFFFRQQRYAVEHAYGPWLKGGDWWKPSLWGWQQWDLVARARDGSVLCCCLVRDLMRNLWQMAALYD